MMNGMKAGLVAGCLAAGVLASMTSVASAQDVSRHSRHKARVRASIVVPPESRPLTINPEPAPVSPPNFEPSLTGQNEDEAYGNIAAFNPSPYTTSGQQYPFGLDGVGGFGSDLGFGAGEDSAVYQR